MTDFLISGDLANWLGTMVLSLSLVSLIMGLFSAVVGSGRARKIGLAMAIPGALGLAGGIVANLQDPQTVFGIMDWGYVDVLPMLNGDVAPIELRDDGAYIAGSQIVLTDIEASNGIIHVIDAVMLPPAE